MNTVTSSRGATRDGMTGSSSPKDRNNGQKYVTALTERGTKSPV